MIEFGWLIGAFIAIIGALVGVGVRRLTHFLYPYDFLTGIVLASLAAAIILIPIIGAITGMWSGSPIDAAGYGAFCIGYVFGYCIDGFRAYFMLRRRIPKDKCAPGEPCVRYKVKGRWAWAGQTNKWLWERLIHKNHVYILCNTPMGDPDWMEPTKYPLFPIFDRQMMMVEDYGVKEAVWKSDRGKEKTRQRYVFWIKKVHGSQVSIDQLCFETDGVEKANAATNEAQHKYTALLHFIKAGLPRLFNNFLASTYDKAPGMSFINITRRAEEMMKNPDDEEIKLKTEAEKELEKPIEKPIKEKEVKQDVQQKTEEREGNGEEKGNADSV